LKYEITEDSVGNRISKKLPENLWKKSYAFEFLYYFEVNFKKGDNKIKHYYKTKFGSVIYDPYSIDYILTAANRWANKQIDDFTLILDMGDYQEFHIKSGVFKDENWQCDCKSRDTSFRIIEVEINSRIFYTKTEPIIYKQKNFHPEGQLFLLSDVKWDLIRREIFDYRKHKLFYSDFTFSQGLREFNKGIKDKESYLILSSLPYARRGMIFEDKFVQNYYESMVWYQPDPKYKKNLEGLSEIEKDWLWEIDEIWSSRNK
jgi:YARHG domain-containing protein